MNHDDALTQATQYRDLLIAKLGEQGFTLTYNRNTLCVYQSTDPATTVSALLRAEAGSKYDRSYSANDPHWPEVVFDPNLPNQRAVHWKGNTKVGWSDETATKHAKQMAEVLTKALVQQKLDHQKWENRQVSEKLAAQVTKNLGDSFSRIRVGASSVEGKVLLELSAKYYLSPDTAEQLAHDLAAVLTRYHLPT
jgi:hypothetical protein